MMGKKKTAIVHINWQGKGRTGTTSMSWEYEGILDEKELKKAVNTWKKMFKSKVLSYRVEYD